MCFIFPLLCVVGRLILNRLRLGSLRFRCGSS
ncbi:hypothetical protein LINPERPRIM_LOCUS37261 [Linum perenne]